MMKSCRLILLILFCPTFLNPSFGQDASESWQKFLPANAFAVVYGKPNTLINDPKLSAIPREILTELAAEAIGVDVTSADSMMAFVNVPSPTSIAPHWGMAFQFREKQELDGSYLVSCVKRQLQGRPFYVREDEDNPPCLFLLDEQTLLVGDALTIPRMLNKEIVESPLQRLLQEQDQTDAHLKVRVAWSMIRPFLMEELDSGGPIPPPFGQLVDIGEVVESISADLSISESLSGTLQLNTRSAESAQETGETISRLLQFGKSLMLTQALSEMTDEDPASRGMKLYLERIATEIVDSFSPKVEGDTVTVEVRGQLSQTGVLIAVLLPAVQSAREAARRAQSLNNLKQLGLAMWNYHETHKSFPPPASVDEDGNPLLSWRVHILPYLNEVELYYKFRLDEPWDSEHNLQLLDKMPVVFANPNLPSKTQTVYLGMTGKNCLMRPGKGVSAREIIDGTTQTLMLVEANPSHLTNWTQPGDLKFNPEEPLQGLIGLRPSGFLATICDGSVKYIPETIAPQTLRAMSTFNGREVIPNR